MYYNKPSNVEDKYDSYILIKFYNEEKYIDVLMNGILYMRSQEIFANISDIGRGDKLEKSEFLFVKAEKSIKDEPKYLQLITSDNKHLLVNNPSSKKNKIFCLYSLWFNSKTGEIKNFDKNIIRDFGCYCCLIYKPDEFYKRVISVDKDNTYGDFVTYIDLDKEYVPSKSFYVKDKKQYGYQNEYRFLYKSNHEMEFIEFNIGSKIDDIAIKFNLNKSKGENLIVDFINQQVSKNNIS